MKIKTKLTSGIGLLFMIIVLLGVLAISYIDKLADDTKNILSDEYFLNESNARTLGGKVKLDIPPAPGAE
ncbi:MAG: hypothetical protein BHV81_04480 [Butyricimonas synergistica]|nr:MAG: hypothetical protein BHV81_04480 [Butyricimonas synergistica]